MIRGWLMMIALVAVARAAPEYVAKGGVDSPAATQAAAADREFVYAVSGKSVVRYDRTTGKETGRSTGGAFHLNSAVFHSGKIYCAHSNYPLRPEESDIRTLDPETMRLTVFHVFVKPPGSLTWALPDADGWWCHFAHYGKDKAKSVLVRYDSAFREKRRWSYPEALVAKWGGSSLSGAILKDGGFLATGHDAKEIYRLKVGETIEWTGTFPSPFPGQGIAEDPLTGGLVGIDRKRKRIVFAELENR